MVDRRTKRDQHHVAGIGGNAGDDTQEHNHKGDHAGVGHQHQLADQGRDQPRLLGQPHTQHGHQNHANNTKVGEVGDHGGEQEADAVGVQEAAHLGGDVVDLPCGDVGALERCAGPGPGEDHRQHHDQADEDQEDDGGVGDLVPHHFDTRQELLKN